METKDKTNSDIFLENKEKNIQEIEKHGIVLESKPLKLGVIITDWCNLRCIMCPDSRHKGSSTLSPSALQEIEEVLPFVENVDWQGGEFFNFTYIKDFFQSLNRFPHIKHDITTNGLLLDEIWTKILMDLNTTVSFSIDSPIKEIYEHIRRGANYSRLIERLKMVMALEHRYNKKLKRNLIAVVMKSNYRYLKEFIPFVKEYGFENICFNPVMHIETEENIFKDPALLDWPFLFEVRDCIKRECAQSGIGFHWTLPVADDAACAVPEAGLRLDKTDIFCNLPWKSLWIAVERSGDIYSSCWCQRPVGNISKSGLLEIWNNQQMQDYRRRIISGDFSLCNKDCLAGYSSYTSPRLS